MAKKLAPRTESDAPLATLEEPAPKARPTADTMLSAGLICARMPKPCPPPGIYPNTPEREYFSWAAVSHSLLKEFKRSALHARHYMDTPEKPPTASMVFGKCGHARLLEPARFASCAAQGPLNPKGVPFGADSDSYRAAAANNPDKILLSCGLPLEAGELWLPAIEAMAARVESHDVARDALRAPGLNECAIVWIDGMTGLPCKARLDRIVSELALIDVKTSTSAEPSGFEWSIDDYGYDSQGAFYQKGYAHALEQTGGSAIGPALPFVMVVIENKAPYALATYRLNQETLVVGEAKCIERIERLARCLASNEWPGYPCELLEIGLPVRALARFTEGQQ